MAKSPVAEVREEPFRFIEPVVNRKVVLRFAAELPRTALCVLDWVGHEATPDTLWSCNPRTGHCARLSACGRSRRGLRPRTRHNRSRSQTAPGLQSVLADARRHRREIRALHVRSIRCRNTSL